MIVAVITLTTMRAIKVQYFCTYVTYQLHSALMNTFENISPYLHTCILIRDSWNILTMRISVEILVWCEENIVPISQSSFHACPKFEENSTMLKLYKNKNFQWWIHYLPFILCHNYTYGNNKDSRDYYAMEFFQYEKIAKLTIKRNIQNCQHFTLKWILNRIQMVYSTQRNEYCRNASQYQFNHKWNWSGIIWVKIGYEHALHKAHCC